MNLARRSSLIYGLVLAAWVLAFLWEITEHLRVRRTAWAGLVARARDVSSTLGVIVRSQQRFAGFVSKESIEAALQSLVKPGELIAIALLNEAGEAVASAGDFPEEDLRPPAAGGFSLFSPAVAVTNLVGAGGGVAFEPGRTNPAIVVTWPRFRGGNRPPPDRERPPGENGPPPPKDGSDGPKEGGRGGGPAAPPPGPGGPGGTNEPFRDPPPWRRGEGRPPRPPPMSDDEFKALIQKKGVQRFAVLLSTDSAQAACRQDLWLRCLIMALGTVAAAGSTIAWRSFSKSAELQIRLVRASEMNSHLKELNLAAAGLAHETRNPLNIIRGLAQMVFKQEELGEVTRSRARAIIDEADRVTAQLTEFINYSRPREVRPAPVRLGDVVAEVLRTLSCDLEEKQIRAVVEGDALVIEADEQMLRQMIFNLVLNAAQAVSVGGEIRIAARALGGAEATLEIRDDGHGVPAELQQQVFKPYFTTRSKGTGLGLAVVQKIVAAHGWEIVCEDNQPKGAVFRISHLRVTA